MGFVNSGQILHRKIIFSVCKISISLYVCSQIVLKIYGNVLFLMVS